MFNNQKFLTRGIESEIPAWLVHLMWHMVLTMEVKEKDYLQVFKLTKTPVGQHIVHEQEQPPYRYELDVPCDDAVDAKVFVIPYLKERYTMKIGYIRVSTEEQNTARQEVLLCELGVDEVFIDKASGKNADRPELTRMMNYVRRGDTVIVESISRFARNTRDLLDLVERLTEKQVEFVSRKEAIDTTTPTGKFMLTVFAAVAELEREYILQRQREGIAIAKEQGKYTGRKPMPLPENFERVVSRWRAGEITAAEAMRQTGLKPNTFYRRCSKASSLPKRMKSR